MEPPEINLGWGHVDCFFHRGFGQMGDISRVLETGLRDGKAPVVALWCVEGVLVAPVPLRGCCPGEKLILSRAVGTCVRHAIHNSNLCGQIWALLALTHANIYDM
jgi:hypothetical protein